ncbi:hypothetical protein [Erwinia phyllosphaerae]|uniref:hypothetical protein n=1 Tax=Erwinia phyllosphaerae TaxID=2853256 RepID=UPI001FED8771|nr:hypothetical protein [Erwinia phyllosphaerae]MBV4365892.1 hypothetical protein [Erwinia phyllosphaerae]
MTKTIKAVSDAISTEHWMTSGEIAQQLEYSPAGVRAALTNLVRSGAIKRKENPDIPRGVLYLKNYVPESQETFGVSEKLSAFDRLIREVRA